MKIGVIGGTFDPIHNGHIMLAEYAYQQFNLDQIWFLPNGNPPHKQNTGISTTAFQRSEMAKLAIRDNRSFRIEEYEVFRDEISYTYETMEYFHTEYPDDHFYFIIGADSLLAFEKWVHPERIVKCCTILAAYRGNMDERAKMEKKIAELNKKYHADIRLLVTPVLNVASHELREKLKAGESVSDQIPEVVEAYIKKHHLYQSEKARSRINGQQN